MFIALDNVVGPLVAFDSAGGRRLLDVSEERKRIRRFLGGQILAPRHTVPGRRILDRSVLELSPDVGVLPEPTFYGPVRSDVRALVDDRAVPLEALVDDGEDHLRLGIDVKDRLARLPEALVFLGDVLVFGLNLEDVRLVSDRLLVGLAECVRIREPFCRQSGEEFLRSLVMEAFTPSSRLLGSRPGESSPPAKPLHPARRTRRTTRATPRRDTGVGSIRLDQYLSAEWSVRV